jgi:uncharacterized membrane protein YedE/YeeE
VRVAAFALGLPFGFVIAWTGMNDPEVIRKMMLFQSFYLYEMFAVAVVSGLAGSLALRAVRARTLVTREPVAWTVARPERRHVVGSVIFGFGWAIASSCPGPIATQLATGLWWSGITIIGIAAGITLFFARAARRSAVRDDPLAAPSPATAP